MKIQFLLLMAITSLILTTLNFEGIRTVFAALAGATVYAVAEYFVHYTLLHRFPKAIPSLYQAHEKHHQYPKELKYLFSPMWYDLVIYVVYFAILWAMFRNFPLVMAVIAGTSLYHLYYQWIHYISHRPVTPLTPWGKWLKKKHLLHHYKDEKAWFGVSHPVLDYLMGTHKPRSSKNLERSDT